MSRELTDEEVTAFIEAEQQKPKKKAVKLEEDPSIPTIDEEELVGNSFKKTVKPRILTPEQVRAEAPKQYKYAEIPADTATMGSPVISSGSQVEEDEEDHPGQWPPHQSINLERQKRTSNWEAGMYEVEIERTWQKSGKDFYHTDENGEPNTIIYLHVGFLTPDGARIQKRMRMSRDERSTQHSLLSAIYGSPPPEIVNTDDLIGKRLKVLIINKVNPRGDEWETIESFMPLATKG